MNYIWVAYNRSGDLIADGYSVLEILRAAERAGYSAHEILIARANA
jgi:hypothetical protein